MFYPKCLYKKKLFESPNLLKEKYFVPLYEFQLGFWMGWDASIPWGIGVTKSCMTHECVLYFTPFHI